MDEQDHVESYFREWQFWVQQVSKATSKTEARAALDKAEDCFRAWGKAILQRFDERARPSINAR